MLTTEEESLLFGFCLPLCAAAAEELPVTNAHVKDGSSRSPDLQNTFLQTSPINMLLPRPPDLWSEKVTVATTSSGRLDRGWLPSWHAVVHNFPSVLAYFRSVIFTQEVCQHCEHT